jgi:hypothetical protein
MGAFVPHDNLINEPSEKSTHSTDHAEMLHNAVKDWMASPRTAATDATGTPSPDAAHILGNFHISDSSTTDATVTEPKKQDEPGVEGRGHDAPPPSEPIPRDLPNTPTQPESGSPARGQDAPPAGPSAPRETDNPAVANPAHGDAAPVRKLEPQAEPQDYSGSYFQPTGPATPVGKGDSGGESSPPPSSKYGADDWHVAGPPKIVYDPTGSSKKQ